MTRHQLITKSHQQSFCPFASAACCRREAQSSNFSCRTFHFIPKGVEHWLYNLSDTVPIEVVGVYCDAGSVAGTGYVYMGDVTAKDLDERTI